LRTSASERTERRVAALRGKRVPDDLIGALTAHGPVAPVMFDEIAQAPGDNHQHRRSLRSSDSRVRPSNTISRVRLSAEPM